jgi:hypothetical protein
MKFKYYIFILLLAVIASCKPEIDEFSPTKGGADFTTYLAVGNSLSAGYADGALYLSGQENSYPNILAKQFKTVGGGEFKQPLTVDNFGIGFDGATPVKKFILGPSTDCKGVTSLAPIRAPGDVNMDNLASVAADGPYNNIAVPGIKSFHFFFDQLAMVNPYYARFAPDANTPVINLTAAIDNSFFTCWVGGNDALGYALAGGAADSLTNPQVFGAAYDGIVQACMGANGAKGALANIPDILSIPYFNTMSAKIPYNALVLTAEQAAGLELLYGAYGYAFEFNEGPNPWVVENSDGTWGRMTADDMFLLTVPSDSIQCHGMGVAAPPPLPPVPFPIPHKYILDKAEIADIRDHVNQYNGIIMNTATVYNLAYVDMNKVLIDVGNGGIMVDGYQFTSTFVQGNTFSLDGIHLTTAGNAMVAHYFIEAINSTYGATLPQVIITDYYGVTFP